MEIDEKLFLQEVGRLVGRTVRERHQKWAAPLQAVVDQLVINLRELENRNEALQKRVSDLEQREWRGVWRAGSYNHYDRVTHDGSEWIALADTETRPGTPNSDWKLTTKRGRNGRDGPSQGEVIAMVEAAVERKIRAVGLAA